MAVSFLINISEEEFKTFLKQALSELFKDGLNTNPFASTTTTEPELMNVKEASTFLRLKVSTIYEKTSLKLIPHSKKGNKLYFNKQELLNWLASGKIKLQSEVQDHAAIYLLQKELKK